MKKSLYFVMCFAFFNVLHATDEEVIVTTSLGGATLAEIAQGSGRIEAQAWARTLGCFLGR